MESGPICPPDVEGLKRVMELMQRDQNYKIIQKMQLDIDASPPAIV